MSYDCAEVSLGFPGLVNATLVENDRGLSGKNAIPCRSRLAGDAGTAVYQQDRVVWIASKPAPTGFGSASERITTTKSGS
ncbi:hypothetical protein EMIT0P44_260081 [Pseudomonas sp. IT-P44]